MLSTTFTSAPTSGRAIQPQTIMDPPPNLTVGWIALEQRLEPFSIQPYCRPSEHTRLTLVSSDQMTDFQSSMVQSRCSMAHWSRRWRWLEPRSGLLTFFFATKLPIFFRAERTVSAQTVDYRPSFSNLVASTAVLATPLLIKLTA